MKEEFIPFPPKDKNMPFFIELAGISYCDGSYRINRQKSPCLCVEYIIEGEGTVIFEGKNYYPQKGDIYILPPGKDHFYFSDEENPWTKIWFNAQGSFINGLLAAYNPQNTVLFRGAKGYEYFSRLHEAGKNPSLSPSQKHEAAAIETHKLFQHLYNKFSAQTKEISKETKLIKEYIDANIEKQISLKTLSELIYLSESQIIRLFRTDLGKTPYDYVLCRKMERAQLLLKSTNLAIKEIAFQLGFSDEHYFSHLFKGKTGKTPTNYRKN